MKVYQNTAKSMGTRFNLLLPGIDKPEGDQLFSTCLSELSHIENKLSCFIPTSEISFLNKNAFDQPVKVNSELFEILKSCLDYHKRTEGLFDISLGNIIDKKTGVLLDEIGVDKIIIDSKKSTIHFSSSQIKINLGGFGKGYALSKVKDLLLKLGVTSAFISFGESSIYCIGKHPYGEYWPVGIQDFYQKGKSLATLKLVNQSSSTSGNLEVDDHIINPMIGKSVANQKMISVKCESPTDAEVLSTVFMIADDHQKEKILEVFSGIEIIEVNYNNQLAQILKYKS